MGDWESLKASYWGTLNYPTEEAPYYESGIWVVGLRADDIVSNSVLHQGMDMGMIESTYADMGGYEIYMVFDKLGNSSESGFRDPPDMEGTPATPEPGRGWDLEAIGQLPPGP